MRKFIVLGFSTNSNKDPGELLYLGSDRGEALAVSGEETEGYCRKEVYELAIPMVRRSFEPVTTIEAANPDGDDPDGDE